MTDQVAVAVDGAALVEALPDVLLAIGGDGRVVYANRAAVEQGWDVDGWTGRSALDLLHPDDVALALSSLTTVQGKTVGTPIEVRIAHPVEGWRWFEVVGRNLLDEHGVIVLSARDLTTKRRWEVAKGDVARFQAVVQHAGSIVMLLTGDGRIDSVNSALTRLLGHDPEMLVGRWLWELCGPSHVAVLQAALGPRAPAQQRLEVPLVAAGGRPARPFRLEIVDLRNDPVVAGFVVTAHDVSELHEARVALEHLATHDALTGLPNRALLLERLDAHLAAPGHGVTALLFVDLDRFKPVNDLLGHDAGDELLIALAERLRRLVRVDDTVARLGGDEFVVLARHLPSLAAAEDLAHRVEQAAGEPFHLSGGVAHVSASVGVAVPSVPASGLALLAEADAAMYRVKTTRRSPGLARPRHIAERRELAQALRGALGRGELVAWFQPVVSATDDALLGFEALLRWQRPGGTVLVPRDFLDVAEEIGLLPAIDNAMLEWSCARLVSLDAPGAWVSVNLTAPDLTDPVLTGHVAELLERTGLAPERLAIEVTEHTTLERPALGSATSPSSTLAELSRLGVRVVLDDFGTGYSSLTHVRRYQLDALKVDHTFVAGVDRDRADQSVIGAIVGLGHALGLSIVAEGVERESQREVLTALGCDAIQGHLVSRPLAPEALVAWLAARA